MKMTVNFEMFRRTMGEEVFSYDGLRTLWNYFEQYEDETGEEIELDPIAFKVEFIEYDNIKDFNNDYGTGYSNYDEITETLVIPIDDERFIIQSF